MMKSLPNLDTDISPLTLGTMTYGTQTPESDAFAQMDFALQNGINAFDTAELYPVNPISRETQGESERIIGRYFQSRGDRENVILMSKIVGIGNMSARNGEPIDKKQLIKALERSLQNLQTDTIDLYQLHWTNRGAYHFRALWGYEVSQHSTSEIEDNLLETLETLDNFKREGKILAYGTSNDTAWGVMKMQELSKANNIIKMSTTQHEYSLLHRIYEPDLSEISQRENIGLLTYSSLACGILTGKYGKDGSQTPIPSRRHLNPDLSGRASSPQVWNATRGYLEIAEKYGIDPVEFAYRFCLSQPFVASVIIGATDIGQLKHIFKGSQSPLPKEALIDIENVRRLFPIPM